MGVDALMSLVTREPLTDDRLRETAWRLSATLGPGWFWLRPGSHMALSQCDKNVSYGNGPSPANTYQVNLWGRYADLAYTSRQGRLDVYSEIAWWLEHEIPGSTVWYGDDASYCLWPFNPRVRARIYHDQTRLEHAFRPIPPCNGRGFCTFCQHQMQVLYQDPHYLLEHCLGCSNALLLRDGQAVETLEAEKIRLNARTGSLKPLHDRMLNCCFRADLIIY